MVDYNLIILMGPSASGKTYAIQNNITKELNIPYVITIDGGDMREASCVYQQAIPKFGVKTYKNIFKGFGFGSSYDTKATVKPKLLEKIKDKLEQTDINFCPKQDEDRCNLQLNSNVNFRQQIKNETTDDEYIEKLFKKSVKCAAAQNEEKFLGFDEPKPHIGIVDTLASKTVEELKTSVSNVLGNPDKTIYYLNLSPKLICELSGKGRSVCEGKKYSSKNWEKSVTNSFNALIEIIKRKDTGNTTIKNIMFNINYGGLINEENYTITLKETNKINSFNIKDKCENKTLNIKKCDSTNVYVCKKDVKLYFDKELYDVLNTRINEFSTFKENLDNTKLNKKELFKSIEAIKKSFYDLSNNISDLNKNIETRYNNEFPGFGIGPNGPNGTNASTAGGSIKKKKQTKKNKKKNKNKRKKRTMKKK